MSGKPEFSENIAEINRWKIVNPRKILINNFQFNLVKLCIV